MARTVSDLLSAAPMGRREALRLVLGALGGLALPRLVGAAAPAGGGEPSNAGGLAEAAAGPVAAPAKALIQIWLWGGPAHLDTFDPKPEAGPDYHGPLGPPLETDVPGLRVGELLPLLARRADRYSLVRGLTHGVGAHETAAYVTQTGHPAGGRDVFPSCGAVVSHFKAGEPGRPELLPPYIVLTEPQGRFSEAGFLGPRHKPFATGGNPAAERFLVEGIAAAGVSEERLRARREWLAGTDTYGRLLRARAPGVLAAHDRAGEEAYEIILGETGRVFDLGREEPAVRERYGRNTLGQSCLVARRLVERGVCHVTVNARGWDTHKRHFESMRRMLPELDRAVSALLDDLGERGLLGSTLVWVGGEFGRTPRVQTEAPWNGGRNHYGKAFSHLVAGGGLRGGRVVGATDARGEEVVERPTHPADLLATLYGRLGIEEDAPLPHPEGRDVRVLPSRAELPARGGALGELL